VELQQEFTNSKVYKNKGGNPDTLQTDDQVQNKQFFLFSQATLELEKGWIFTAGASLNLLTVDFNRISFPSSDQTKKFNNEVAPRFAVLKKITPLVSLFASVSRGFSPPTTAELLPSTGVISTALQAEHGWNFEGGLKGNLLKGKIFFDLNVFYLRLSNTIAARRDFSGGDYFVNAGNTKQNGVESFVSYRLYDQANTFINHIKIWGSYTYSNFHYANFEKIAADTSILSGKRLPSIAPNYLSAGIDITTTLGFYVNSSYYYSDPIPLNDVNTAYASSYNLMNARIGFRKVFSDKIYGNFFVAGDNLFNVKYSLGNDINAAGKRYYNASPERNYSVGISMRYNW
ncbi:MAG: TonB-dependent receptor, partial [Flavitalea sp.]